LKKPAAFALEDTPELEEVLGQVPDCLFSPGFEGPVGRGDGGLDPSLVLNGTFPMGRPSAGLKTSWDSEDWESTPLPVDEELQAPEVPGGLLHAAAGRV
jgi:hypothetical protein